MRTAGCGAVRGPSDWILVKRCDINSLSEDLWLILSQIYTVSGDSASNNKTMMQHIQRGLADKYNHNRHIEFIPCLAHILHNCVLAFFNQLKVSPDNKFDLYYRSDELNKRKYDNLKRLKGFARTTAKIREIAKATRNSSKRHDDFQALVQSHYGSKLELKVDVQTRWHSTAVMLHRALTLQPAITQWLSQTQTLDSLALKDCKWAEIELILCLLKPFYDCSLQLMVAKGITIHLTYKVYDYLFDHIEQMKQQLQPRKAGDGRQINHAGHFLEALEAAEQKLRKYYAQTD